MKKNDETTRIVKAIKKTIPKNCNLPILENVLLTGENCIATDLEVSVSIPFKSIPCVFPARDFCDVLTEHGRAFQIATNKERKIFVTAGNEKLTVTGEDAENYPSVNIGKGETVGVLSDTDFQSLQTAAHFIDNEKNGRISMQHILWHQHCVGTCGHRLYWKKSDCVPSLPVLILPKTLELLAIFGVSWNVSIIREDATKPTSEIQKLVFVDSDGVLISQTFCAEMFPRYDQVIPTDNKKRFTIDKKELIAVVSKVSKYAPEPTKKVRFSLNGKSIVSAEDIDFGREFSVETSGKYEGEPLEIGFNADLLTSILKQSPAETTTILIDKADRGVIIDDNFLLMPVKLNP